LRVFHNRQLHDTPSDRRPAIPLRNHRTRGPQFRLAA
jgi:hypothetical protein